MIPHIPQRPIRELELLWLHTAYAYEELHETLMADTDWDLMGKELNGRREEWTPYFRNSLPIPDYNPGTTGSGLDWSKGVPSVVALYMDRLNGDLSEVITRFSTSPIGGLQGITRP